MRSADRTAGISPGGVAAALAAVLVVAAAVFWFAHVPRERAETLATWQRDLGLRAGFRRDALDDYLKERLADARLLASFPSVQALVAFPRPGPDAHGRAHIEEVLREFREAYGYQTVGIFDAAGAPAGGLPSATPDPGCRDAARGVLASKAPAVSIHAHAGAPFLLVASPIRDRSGALRGSVVTLTPAATRLYPLTGEALSPRSGEAVLLARDGDRAVYLSPLRYRSDPPLTLRRPLDEERFVGRVALERPAAEGVFTDYRGERVVAATRRLTAAPWALVLKVDETEALEPFFGHVANVAVGWGFALVAVLALSWGVSQRLQRVRAAADAASEARFRTLFEQASDAVFVVGADGRIQDANRAAEEMHGVPRGALAGTLVTDLRPSEQRRAAQAAFVASESMERLVFVAEHVRADGTRFPVEISTRRAELAGGPVHVEIVRDLGARRGAAGEP